MTPVRVVGFIANPHKPAAFPLATSLLARLTSRGAAVHLAPEIAARLSNPPGAVAARSIRDLSICDLILILGGDGTILHAVRELGGSAAPLLGINAGSLGFLTEASGRDALTTVDRILDGHFDLIVRPILKASIVDETGTPVTDLRALNDVVVDEGSLTRRAVRLKMRLGQEDVGSFTADGVVVATPAGSTAYNMSAGGPVVVPGLQALVATPICVHTMAVRPFVFPDSQTLDVEDLREGLSIKVTVDGQVHALVPQGGRVSIRVDPERSARFAVVAPSSYFDDLRRRLAWGTPERDG